MVYMYVRIECQAMVWATIIEFVGNSMVDTQNQGLIYCRGDTQIERGEESVSLNIIPSSGSQRVWGQSKWKSTFIDKPVNANIIMYKSNAK